MKIYITFFKINSKEGLYMRYWIVFIVYICFIFFYVNYAQGCSTSEQSVVTGAACSIKDLPKLEMDDLENSKNKQELKDDNEKKKLLNNNSKNIKLKTKD